MTVSNGYFQTPIILWKWASESELGSFSLSIYLKNK